MTSAMPVQQSKRKILAASLVLALIGGAITTLAIQQFLQHGLTIENKSDQPTSLPVIRSPEVRNPPPLVAQPAITGAIRKVNTSSVIELAPPPRSSLSLASGSADFYSGFSKLNSAGSWTYSEGVLHQQAKDAGWARFPNLVFGDPDWKDYDLSVSVKATDVGDGVGVVFHHQKPGDCCYITLGSYANQGHDLSVLRDRRWSRPNGMYRPGSIRPDVWYAITLVVRGPSCVCRVDGEKWFVCNDLPFAQGRVGFRTWASVCQFKDVLVKRPDGTVLWKGLPNSIAPAENENAINGKLPAAEKLSQVERHLLQIKFSELIAAATATNRPGREVETARLLESSLGIAHRLYPKESFPNGHRDLVLGLAKLGKFRRVMGDLKEAEDLLREAAMMAKHLPSEQGRPQGRIEVQGAIMEYAVVLRLRQKHKEAESVLSELAEANRKEFGDHEVTAKSLTNLAYILRSMGNERRAESVCVQALEVYQRLYPKGSHPNGHEGVVTGLSNLGILHRELNRPVAAEIMHRAALEMSIRLSPADNSLTASCLDNLAISLSEQGKHADAEKFIRNALDMRHRMFRSDHFDIIESLGKVAVVLKKAGNLAGAEGQLLAAIDMGRRLYPEHGFPAGHPQIANSLVPLALLYRDQGQLLQADERMREALDVYRRCYRGDDPDKARCLGSLGGVLRDQGDFQAAEPLLRESLEMWKRIYPGDHGEIAAVLSHIAGLLYCRSKYDDSEEYFRDSLAMCQRIHPGDHPSTSSLLINVACLALRRGNYNESESLHRNALGMARRLFSGPHPDTITILSGLALTLACSGKPREADPLYREALAMHRELLAGYAGQKTEGETLSFASATLNPLSAYLSNATNIGENPETVYREVWKSKALISSMFERRQLQGRAADNLACRPLLASLSAARRERSEILLAPVPVEPATIVIREKRLSDLAESIRKHHDSLRSILPIVDRFDKLLKSNPVDLQSALTPDLVVVDFLYYARYHQDNQKPGLEGLRRTTHYIAFIISNSKVVMTDLGEAAPIEEAVSSWRKAITTGKSISPSLSNRVRDLVWRKVRTEIPTGVKVVYISPDSDFCRIPWAAIPGDAPGTILIENFAVATVPNARFLLDVLTRGTPPINPAGGVFAVGGVAYGTSLPAGAGKELQMVRPPLKPAGTVVWASLDHTASESLGVSVAANRKRLPVKMLDNGDATNVAVLSALSKARYAHLATHGFFTDASFRSALNLDPQEFWVGPRGERVGRAVLNPLVMTGLVFAGANHAGTPGRGLVTGEALVDLNLSGLELAVLSACESGVGNLALGEGVFGLQRAFHMAGTRDVVATLWKIPDQATAALMGEFYRRMWEDGLSPLEALRQAQLEIYRHPEKVPELAAKFRSGPLKVVPQKPVDDPNSLPLVGGKAHPRLWAAFILSGPGR